MAKQRTWRVATTASTYAITSNNDNNNTTNNDNDTDNDTNNSTSTNGAAAHVARGCRWLQFDIVFIAVRNEIASCFLTIFGTKTHLEEPWGTLGPPCGTLGSPGTYKARLGPAIWHQKSLPESRRVAPGTPLGDIFEARGRLFHEKNATRMRFYYFVVCLCHERRFSHFWDRFLIDLLLKKC